MITSGRCHGPGCQREASEGAWCSPACREGWHAEFHWLYGDGEVLEPVIVREIEEDDEPAPEPAQVVVNGDGSAALSAALEAAQPEAERQFVAALNTDHLGTPRLPGSVAYGDIVRLYESLLPTDPPEPVKLTQGQLDVIRQSATPEHPWTRWGALGDLSGVPIELVERVEDSTLYQQARGEGAAKPLVASENPQVAQSDQMRGWLGRWLHRMRRTR
jgi:hypothetical protein